MSASDYPPRPSPIAPGYKLDRYEMLCPIAEGGMASVWIARLRGKRGFEKVVAIKTILPKYAQDARFQRMFLDEAGLAARIEHVNVAQVLDLGEEHDVLYLSMELVDGDALSKLLRVVQKKGLEIPPGIVMRILADTCGGLHAAHEVRGRDGALLNVVHRDVSPQNILVTMHGVAKLIDFGIAKARDRLSEDTSEGMLKGKIQFMAPEQAIGGDIDRRADIFAVGAILYFLLSGKPPFAGETEAASLFRLSSRRPPLPLPTSVHPAVSAVVMKALAREPDDRYATAADMQTAMEAAMVESGLATTTAMVATFVQEHMADRARRRKEGLDLALSAAAHREKVAKMLERAGADSASGLGTPVSGTGLDPVTGATYATVLLGTPSSHLRTPTPHTGTGARGVPLAETLEPTMDAPVPRAGLPRKVGWLAVTAVVVIGLTLAAGFVVRSKRRPPVAAAPRPSAVATVVASTAEPPPVVPAAKPSASAVASASASTGYDLEILDAAPTPTAAPGDSAGTQTGTSRPRVHKPATTTAPSSSAAPKPRVNDGF